MNWEQIAQLVLAAIAAILQAIQAGGGTPTAEQVTALQHLLTLNALANVPKP